VNSVHQVPSDVVWPASTEQSTTTDQVTATLLHLLMKNLPTEPPAWMATATAVMLFKVVTRHTIFGEKWHGKVGIWGKLVLEKITLDLSSSSSCHSK